MRESEIKDRVGSSRGMYIQTMFGYTTLYENMAVLYNLIPPHGRNAENVS